MISVFRMEYELIDVEGAEVRLWHGNILGSLVRSDGSLNYPERTCLALTQRMKVIDIENTLDTASAVSSSHAQISPSFLFLIARVVKIAPVTAKPKPGWWQVLQKNPVLHDALLACADNFGSPDYARYWLRYETTRRLVASDETRLRLPTPVTT